MSSIDELLRNNADYAARFRARGLTPTPAQAVAVVACMDARLDLHALLGLAEGDAHLLRNAGGIVTDDVIRSLAMSQKLLGTRRIMLVHHTDCGMQSFTDDAMADEIERETGSRPPFPLGAFTDLDASVRESIARIRKSPFLQLTESVRGFVYDVETGRLREVG